MVKISESGGKKQLSMFNMEKRFRNKIIIIIIIIIKMVEVNSELQAWQLRKTLVENFACNVQC